MRVLPSTRSLRWRISAVATAAVALVLTVTAVLLVGAQRQSLMAAVDDALDERADTLAAAVADGVPDDFAVGDGRGAQLIGANGRLLASTPNLRATAPLAPPPANGQAITDVVLSRDDDAFRVLSRHIEVGGDPAVLHVAENTDHVGESVTALVRSLLGAFPLLLLLLAGLTWWLVGRTLRPVEEAMQRQQRFVADASHELRTPLTRIRTRLEVDRAHPDTADPDATAAGVLEETRGMQRLVDDLLHLARADARGIDLRKQRFELDDVVLTEATFARADGESVRLDVSDVQGAEVVGDRAQLARMVRNLVDNAVRHATTTVHLALRATDGSVELEVTDDGAGIPPNRRAEVFERFTRLDPARAADRGGTGLGLAIAQDIVHRHGGRIAITDAPGGGSRVVVTLPAGRQRGDS